MISLLIALILSVQSQSIKVNSVPNHEFVLQATVPMPDSFSGSLVIEDFPTDSRLIATAQNWKIYEVCALVPPGRNTFEVNAGVSTTESLVNHLLPYAVWPGLIKLKLTDGQGSSEFSLTGKNDKFLTRAGKVYKQIHRHISLGRFGWAHVWIGMRANTNQLDFAILMHNGIPGPDILLNSAEIITPNGIVWQSSLSDPACLPPYLIKPGQHIFPQQFVRPFWFSVFPTGVVPEKEYIGVADWSEGGYLPSAFPVPNMTGISYVAELIDRRMRFATVQPTSEEPGSTPVSFLWPAAGVTQSDMGGGIGRFPLDGARWAASGDINAQEYFRTGMCRDNVRSRRRFETDGKPLRLTGGTWQFFDGFLAGNDSPWEWDRWSPNFTIQQDPRIFHDYGIATLLRSYNDMLPLAWLSNDPMAKLLIFESATRARMTYWEAPGIARNLWLPPDTGLGSYIGIGEANAGLIIAAAISFGATEYGPWTATFLEHLRRVQMESGCFSAHEDGYPVDRSPFNGQYLLQGGTELALLTLAAYSLGDREMIEGVGRAMLNIATDDDDAGFYYYFATGQDNIRYVTEDDWPDSLYDLMGIGGINDASYYTAWDMGYAVALMRDTPSFQALAERFTMSVNPLGTITSWGFVAPDTQTRAPFEQWWPLLGILQNQ